MLSAHIFNKVSLINIYFVFMSVLILSASFEFFKNFSGFCLVGLCFIGKLWGKLYFFKNFSGFCWVCLGFCVKKVEKLYIFLIFVWNLPCRFMLCREIMGKIKFF